MKGTNKTELVGRVITDNGEIHYVSPYDNNQVIVLKGNFDEGFVASEERLLLESTNFLTPVEVGKFIGIGRNFPGEPVEKESQFPNFFLKTANAVVPHLSNVELPFVFKSSVIEGEFGVILSKKAKDVQPDEVKNYILGYVSVCDLSGRNFIDGDNNSPVALKKSCDGFAPVGPFLKLSDSLQHFNIQTFVDGVLMQSGHSKDMIYSIETCISYISRVMTLEPFDLISMGTPNPKPTIEKGQSVRVTISDIPSLEFKLI